MSKTFTVWCLVFEDSSIKEATLVRTNQTCRIKLEGDTAYIRDEELIKKIDSALHLYEKFNNEWCLNFFFLSSAFPNMIVCSSLTKACDYLREKIHQKRQDIEQCEYMLATTGNDDQSIALQMQPYINARLQTVTEVEPDTVLIQGFHNDAITTYKQMASTVNQRLNDVFGCGAHESGEFVNDKVLVQINAHSVLFYIEKSAFDRIMKQYKKIPRVANVLQQMWNTNQPHFPLEFVHCDDIPINSVHKFCRNNRIGSINYEELLESISSQMAKELSIAARTKRVEKSSNRPIQFVLSQRAANENADWIEQPARHIIMRYANDTKQEVYYGLTKPMQVHCHERLDGSIYLKVECDAHNTKSLTKKEYISLNGKSQNILDVMMEAGQ